MTSLHSLPIGHSLSGQLFAFFAQWPPMFQHHQLLPRQCRSGMRRNRRKHTAGWAFTTAITLAAMFEEGEDARI
jgi:hypothetical protein